MSNNILFIFEGQRSEPKIVSSLQKYFVNERTVIQCVYGAEIYQIYKEILEDNDLDVFNLLKERNNDISAQLDGFKRSDFAEIYLFFDYDGHATNASDNDLVSLLEFFNEETDKGKLYISYPMVEALKHIESNEKFMNLTVECRENIRYKQLVNEKCLNKYMHISRYDKRIWVELIEFHIKKMNMIVNDSFTFPNSFVSQSLIFKHQSEKYIDVNSTVAVLSSFPVFIHDYYGNQRMINMLYNSE